jgi:hypothetical protein
MLMTPFTTPFDKQSHVDYMGFDGNNLDKKYSAGHIGGDDYDDIERICEVKNVDHPRNDNENYMNDKNDKNCDYDNDGIEIRGGLKNEYNDNDWKNRHTDDSDIDDYSRSLLMQSYLASPSSSVVLKKNNGDHNGMMTYLYIM